MNTPTLFLKWVTDKYKPIYMDRAHQKAQEYCRNHWEKYGEKVIKKALYMNNCTTLNQFEIHCVQINKMK